jgi:hypothetical protein
MRDAPALLLVEGGEERIVDRGAISTTGPPT